MRSTRPSAPSVARASSVVSPAESSEPRRQRTSPGGASAKSGLSILGWSALPEGSGFPVERKTRTPDADTTARRICSE